MPEKTRRSRSRRKIFKKGFGVVYRDKESKKKRCYICKAVLKGTKDKGAKTEKRPERMYGGVLCSACSRNIIKQFARK